jgi:hypothetical protein
MMPAEFAICVSAVFSIVNDHATKQTTEYKNAVAHNICAASNAENFDPRVMTALIMGENRKFDTAANGPASIGVDIGLCQLNSHHQRHRITPEQALHPYYCTRVAASILKKHERIYGGDWRVIASYWNPTKAREGAPEAIQYYNRWRANYLVVAARFNLAGKMFPTADLLEIGGSQ